MTDVPSWMRISDDKPKRAVTRETAPNQFSGFVMRPPQSANDPALVKREDDLIRAIIGQYQERDTR